MIDINKEIYPANVPSFDGMISLMYEFPTDIKVRIPPVISLDMANTTKYLLNGTAGWKAISIKIVCKTPMYPTNFSTNNLPNLSESSPNFPDNKIPTVATNKETTEVTLFYLNFFHITSFIRSQLKFVTQLD